MGIVSKICWFLLILLFLVTFWLLGWFEAGQGSILSVHLRSLDNFSIQKMVKITLHEKKLRRNVNSLFLNRFMVNIGRILLILKTVNSTRASCNTRQSLFVCWLRLRRLNVIFRVNYNSRICLRVIIWIRSIFAGTFFRCGKFLYLFICFNIFGFSSRDFWRQRNNYLSFSCRSGHRWRNCNRWRSFCKLVFSVCKKTFVSILAGAFLSPVFTHFVFEASYRGRGWSCWRISALRRHWSLIFWGFLGVRFLSFTGARRRFDPIGNRISQRCFWLTFLIWFNAWRLSFDFVKDLLALRVSCFGIGVKTIQVDCWSLFEWKILANFVVWNVISEKAVFIFWIKIAEINFIYPISCRCELERRRVQRVGCSLLATPKAFLVSFLALAFKDKVWGEIERLLTHHVAFLLGSVGLLNERRRRSVVHFLVWIVLQVLFISNYWRVRWRSLRGRVIRWVFIKSTSCILSFSQ